MIRSVWFCSPFLFHLFVVVQGELSVNGAQKIPPEKAGSNGVRYYVDDPFGDGGSTRSRSPRPVLPPLPALYREVDRTVDTTANPINISSRRKPFEQDLLLIGRRDQISVCIE